MPASHHLNRRIAALGTALALVMLPLSGTLTSGPALAQPSPSAEAASSAGADGGTEAGADESDGSTSGAKADGSEAKSDDQGEGGENDASSDDDPKDDTTIDGACKKPGDDEDPPAEDTPCVTADALTAKWHASSQTLSIEVSPGEDGKRGQLPKSWVGHTFEGPDRKNLRVPAQRADQGGSTEDHSTDDSGNPLPSSDVKAAAPTVAPTQFEFNSKGEIVAAGEETAYKFEDFPGDPKWTFKVDDSGDENRITVTGDPYPPDGGDEDAGSDKSGSSEDGAASSSGSSTNDQDGSADNGSANNRANGNSDKSGSGNDSGSGSQTDGSSNRNSGSDDNRSSRADSNSSTDSSSSSSNTQGRANDSSDGGNDSKDSKDSDSSSGSGSSDGSKGSNGSDESKDSDSDKNGSAASSDGDNANGNRDDANRSSDGNTPDPSTGNGSKDERSTIPGTAGDEWLPGDDEKSQRPDYSDPVPRNPDSPAPDDDTDLITGGNKPQPRGNDQPSTSFGESIVSTIVSSWPIFVLAASGMAAVGFIIYLMGRRSKRS